MSKELQALWDQELREQRARRELEQERVRRWRLLHPPKPPPSSDDEDDITFEELWTMEENASEQRTRFWACEIVEVPHGWGHAGEVRQG